jgi:hypothetical protein
MLGWLKWRWLRGIYSPQPPNNCWGWAAVDGRTGQSGAPPNTVRCASHVTQPLGIGRSRPLEHVFLWHRTVRCRTRQALFTVRCTSGDCSDFCAHCSSLFTESAAFAVERCMKEPLLRWCTGQSGDTPDSPVNYSGARPEKPEGGGFRVVRS